LTAAFWSDNGRIAAAEKWCEVYSNGGFLLRRQLLTSAEAIGELEEYYGLSPRQVVLLKSLFRRRMATGANPLLLDESDIAALAASGTSSLEEGRALLVAAGILFQ